MFYGKNDQIYELAKYKQTVYEYFNITMSQICIFESLS